MKFICITIDKVWVLAGEAEAKVAATDPYNTVLKLETDAMSNIGVSQLTDTGRAVPVVGLETLFQTGPEGVPEGA